MLSKHGSSDAFQACEAIKHVKQRTVLSCRPCHAGNDSRSWWQQSPSILIPFQKSALHTLVAGARRVGVHVGSEAALDAAAARLQSALTDHGCRGTPACEGLSGATKVFAVYSTHSCSLLYQRPLLLPQCSLSWPLRMIAC